MCNYPTQFTQSCQSNLDCQWLYQCKQTLCTHLPIFPLETYPIIIYFVLIPIASGLVNISGNSLGMFKVFIIMTLLRYDIGQATVIIQPLVAGAAITNFFIIIFKRHPILKTSLVNYNLVKIIVPSSLFGSTLGSLLHDFVPQIGQAFLIFLLFSYFTYSFYQKLRKLRKDDLSVDFNQDLNQKQQKFISSSKSIQNNNQNMKQLESSKDPRYIKIQKYQDTIHLFDILNILIVFFIFQGVAFIAQGKVFFLQFGKCDWKYFVGIGILGMFTIFYLLLVRRNIKKYFRQCEQINYPVDIKLNSSKQFWIIVLGGFIAGLTQGILGVGSGTCIMYTLLLLKIPPMVASACSGFQIFFIGSSAMIVKFIQGQINFEQILFLMGISSIIGGIITFFMYKWLKNKQQTKLKKILLIIMMILSIISLIGTIPNILLRIINFGWQKVLIIHWAC